MLCKNFKKANHAHTLGLHSSYVVGGDILLHTATDCSGTDLASVVLILLLLGASNVVTAIFVTTCMKRPAQTVPAPSGPVKRAVSTQSSPVKGAVSTQSGPVKGAVSTQSGPVKGAVSTQSGPVKRAVSIQSGPVKGAVSTQSGPVKRAVSIQSGPVKRAVSTQSGGAVSTQSDPDHTEGAVSIRSDTGPRYDVMQGVYHDESQ